MAKSVHSLLETYRGKRDFTRTPEPSGEGETKSGEAQSKSARLHFVVQKHAARRLHYDFRLELDGVLKSWAVTKGPSLDPADKRLAVRTEDHPISYGTFEGVIPSGYGAGTVMLWDEGEWIPESDPQLGLRKGSLKFELHGARLKGSWALVLMKNRSPKGRENWLLIKHRDEAAVSETDVLDTWTTSVTTDRDFGEIERDARTPKSPVAKSSRSVFPPFIPPQLASLRDAPPSGKEWLHELKFDGYRIQAHLSGGRVRLMTRNAKDWTDRYPSTALALSRLPAQTATVDGELVALGDDGRSSFSALQTATENGRTQDLVYFAFDLLTLDGKTLRRLPLVERKDALKKLLAQADPAVRLSDHIAGAGQDVIARACQMGLEGIVSKKLSAAYISGRSSAWIKSKCIGRDEFVIGGYRRSDKRGRKFSSLLVGEFENGRLVYAGRVGSGFSQAVLDELAGLMVPLQRETPAFEGLTADSKRDAVWLDPELVAEISYPGRTEGGLLRQPVYLGLREDKPAEQVQSSPRPRSRQRPSARSAEKEFPGLRLTTPERIVFADGGVTKRDVAQYMANFAPHILPFLKDHPVSLVRCPEGQGGKCFFQKHVNASSPDEFGKVAIVQGDGKRADYILLNSARALVAAAQSGTLELHLWGSRADRLEQPDRLVIDLDPDEELPFSDVRSAACEVRDVLESAGLTSFPLLTGGKGIHVVAPLVRRREWASIKSAARGLARQMANARPDTYVAEMSRKKREGRIFIDWLRNERGATAICPYSLRARPGAPIAAPVSWEELRRIRSANQFTLLNIRSRISRQTADPWYGYHSLRQSLSKSVIDVLST